MGQMGFFDVERRYAGLDAKQDPLLGIDALVPWESFRGRLEAVWRKPAAERKSKAGRKPWDAVVMFKAIVLCERVRAAGQPDPSKDRARVEHVLGAQTNDMGGTLVRSIGVMGARGPLGPQARGRLSARCRARSPCQPPRRAPA